MPKLDTSSIQTTEGKTLFIFVAENRGFNYYVAAHAETRQLAWEMANDYFHDKFEVGPRGVRFIDTDVIDVLGADIVAKEESHVS